MIHATSTPALPATFLRTPKHVGLIPDGNRRWAGARGLSRHEGYASGIEPGVELLDVCRAIGIHEVSVYGFTKENVRRPAAQVRAFQSACVSFALRAVERGAALLVVGDAESSAFPRELQRFTSRSRGDLRVNLLANYGWQWDVGRALTARTARRDPLRTLGSADVSSVDLVVRWGGHRRLSGFLPLQCAYADFHVVDTLWPDMRATELLDALRWYERQDVTKGG